MRIWLGKCRRTLTPLAKRALQVFGFEVLPGPALRFVKRHRIDPSIGDNYGLSIVIPFYKKLHEFAEVLPVNASYLARNGIEVVIALDEPTQEEALLELIKRHREINWRVVVNDYEHEWRNPSKAINVGIRHASKDLVLIMSPESQFVTDVPTILVNAMKKHRLAFATGSVQFENYDGLWHPYGSICIRRSILDEIGGYNESFQDWGSDDDEIRMRLENAGLRNVYTPGARLLHREQERRCRKTTSPSSQQIVQQTKVQRLSKANDENWGRAFHRVTYDYLANRFAREMCGRYLEQNCKRFEIPKSEALTKSRNLVALVPVYKCRETLPELLGHLERHCDGIILLDDESGDGTYEAAQSSALLIKAEKTRQGFNDLQNRNMLLEMASFVKSRWLIFIDADERFDERFNSPRRLVDVDADIIGFPFVHLWDGEDQYCVDYPASKDGIQIRLKMFRHFGRTQILSKKALHFAQVPFRAAPFTADALIKHYGRIDQDTRAKKFVFYQHEDRDQSQADYRHLLRRNAKVASLDQLKID